MCRMGLPTRWLDNQAVSAVDRDLIEPNRMAHAAIGYAAAAIDAQTENYANVAPDHADFHNFNQPCLLQIIDGIKGRATRSWDRGLRC